jgi:hypothetical protein
MTGPIITNLTGYHREQLREYRRKWEEIVLSTKPAQRDLTERGIALAYEQGGLGKPKIVWCSSPLSLALTVAFLKGVSKGSPTPDISLTRIFWQRLRESCVQTVLDDVRNAVASLEIEDLLNCFEMVASGVRTQSIENLDWSLGNSVYQKIFYNPTERVEFNLFDRPNSLIASPVFSEIVNYLGQSFQPWQEVLIKIPPPLEGSLDVMDANLIWKVSRRSANRLILRLNPRWVDPRWVDGFNSGNFHVEPPKIDCPQGEDDKIDYACRWTLHYASDALLRFGLHGVRIGRYSILDFSKQVFALNEQAKELEGVQLIMENADGCVPFENCCLVCERPTALNLAEVKQWIEIVTMSVKRLHNESGPALSYSDGWSIFSWYGVEVPEYFITAPHMITIAQIESESNAEVRRLMIERFGKARFISESGAQEIHQD